MISMKPSGRRNWRITDNDLQRRHRGGGLSPKMPLADWTASSNLLFIGMDTARTATFNSGSTDRHE